MHIKDRELVEYLRGAVERDRLTTTKQIERVKRADTLLTELHGEGILEMLEHRLKLAGAVGSHLAMGEKYKR